jgi:Rap guanine nucleotide exchange factor 2
MNFDFFSSEFDTPGSDNALDSSVLSTSNSSKSLPRSSSNPDLSPSSISNKSMSSLNGAIDEEENSTFVVKVYRSDQSFKYFPVLKDTTAKQVVMLAITEFNIGDQSRY